MLTTNHLHRRIAHSTSRGGFTLVELLVVIGIIAILAGVALGPITNGIKKAKQSSALQSAHAIGLAMYSLANDNGQLYADPGTAPLGIPVGNPDAAAKGAVVPLLAGGYVTDPAIFFIAGGTASKFTGTAASAATAIAATNISWDFMGNGGNGVSATNYQYIPILWTSIGTSGVAATNGLGTAAASLYGTPGAANPFQTDGVAIFYNNNASKFITSAIVSGTKQVLMVDPATNSGGAPASLVVLYGGG